MDTNQPGLLAPDLLAKQRAERQKGQTAFMQSVGNIPQGQNVGGHYVAPSATQYLANALNSYNAAQQVWKNQGKG